MAKSPAGVRMGNAVGGLDGSHAGSVCDLSRHRRARARYAFQPGMGAGEHDFCLGRPCANHPDLDARFRREGGAGGDRRDRQCDPAVSDGGVCFADDANATDKAAPTGAGDPFHRGHLVGRMLSSAAAGAARAPYRLHPWSRRRSALGLPCRDRDRLRPRIQSPATGPGSELLVWVRAVATAILAGVIAQILVSPPGALASVPGWLRYTAVAAGFSGFIVTRRSTLAGVVCGELVMLAGKWWLG